MNGYAPLGGRSKAVVIVFVLITLVWVLTVVFSVQEILVLNRMVAGEEVSDAEFNATQEPLSAISTIGWAAWIAGAIAFITWMYRAYGNVDAVDPGGRRYGHGWAIGAWFVPVLAMWRPKQIINDIWRAGDGERGFAIGTLWWILWLLPIPMGWLWRGDYSNSEDAETVRDAAIGLLVADVFGTVAAVLAIVVAVAATNRLDRRAAAPPPPRPEWRLFPPRAEDADEQPTAQPG